MDMGVWRNYFTTGLQTQMVEVKKRAKQFIRRGILVLEHSLWWVAISFKSKLRREFGPLRPTAAFRNRA